MKISGNTILLTGGATGIGFALSQKLLESGNQVIICGRREQKLEEAAHKLEGLQIKTCDVSKESERIALRDFVVHDCPEVNVLMNNAGIQKDIDFLEGNEDWKHIGEEISTNLEAPIHLSSLFVPHLRRKSNAAIVNVSSGLAFTPSSLFPIYCATKAAIHSFSLTLRHQLMKVGIEVIEVIPPAVDSELNYEGRVKRGFLKTGVTAEEFASSVMEGLKAGNDEIAYGNAERGRMASRAELDEAFKRMNQ